MRDDVEDGFEPIDGIPDTAVTMSAGRPDGMGLDTTYGSVALFTQSSASNSELPVPVPSEADPTAVSEALAAEAGVDVFATPTEYAYDTTDNRTHDTGARGGGAHMHFTEPATAYSEERLLDCSTGFGVTTDEGGPGVLTAGHCGINAWMNYGQELGAVHRWVYDLDTMVIATTRKSDRTVYFGGFATKVKRRIHGAMQAKAGLYVCTSGAMSGKHCKIKVTYDNSVQTVRDRDGVAHTYYGQGTGLAPAGKMATTDGDSGGPVVAYRPGSNKMRAVGTISGGSSKVDCPRRRAGATGPCYRYVSWENIRWSLFGTGSTLRHY